MRLKDMRLPHTADSARRRKDAPPSAQEMCWNSPERLEAMRNYCCFGKDDNDNDDDQLTNTSGGSSHRRNEPTSTEPGEHTLTVLGRAASRTGQDSSGEPLEASSSSSTNSGFSPFPARRIPPEGSGQRDKRTKRGSHVISDPGLYDEESPSISTAVKNARTRRLDKNGIIEKMDQNILYYATEDEANRIMAIQEITQAHTTEEEYFQLSYEQAIKLTKDGKEGEEERYRKFIEELISA